MTQVTGLLNLSPNPEPWTIRQAEWVDADLPNYFGPFDGHKTQSTGVVDELRYNYYSVRSLYLSRSHTHSVSVSVSVSVCLSVSLSFSLSLSLSVRPSQLASTSSATTTTRSLSKRERERTRESEREREREIESGPFDGHTTQSTGVVDELRYNYYSVSL